MTNKSMIQKIRLMKLKQFFAKKQEQQKYHPVIELYEADDLASLKVKITKAAIDMVEKNRAAPLLENYSDFLPDAVEMNCGHMIEPIIVNSGDSAPYVYTDNIEQTNMNILDGQHEDYR